MAADIGVQRMLGWLLRSNRLLADVDPRLRSGKEFARLFRRTGEGDLAPSQVTRWERGDTAVSRNVVRRYETMLGLAPDSLVTVGDAIRRADRTHTRSGSRIWNAPARSRPDAAPGDHTELYELLELAGTGQPMDGLRWSTLGELLQGTPDLLLFPATTWDAVSGRLLAELVVADHREWLLRQEAMSKLVEHPVGARYAINQCIDLVRDRHSPAVLEPMSLLDVTRHPAANRYLLAQLAEPDDERALHAAALTIRQKALRGHFDPGQLSTIATVAGRRAGDGWAGAPVSASLSELGTAMGRSAAAPSAGGRVRAVHPVSSRVAARALGEFPDAREDELLPYLVDEAVFDPDSERRMLAAMCLAATPYQAPIAGALVEEVRGDLVRRSRQLPLTVLRTLTTLSTDVHRPVIRHILSTPAFAPSLREAAASALPHCAGRYSASTWRELLEQYGSAWRRSRSAHLARVLEGIAYGIGTDGHRRLTGQLKQDERMPAEVRRTAAWLHRTRTHLHPGDG